MDRIVSRGEVIGMNNWHISTGQRQPRSERRLAGTAGAINCDESHRPRPFHDRRHQPLQPHPTSLLEADTRPSSWFALGHDLFNLRPSFVGPFALLLTDKGNVVGDRELLSLVRSEGVMMFTRDLLTSPVRIWEPEVAGALCTGTFSSSTRDGTAELTFQRKRRSAVPLGAW